ncbi:DUF4190 domain-containing protein [Ruania rhizosphaerae]|uniref:DUF4190 domain-containing protein n=1 Tax=Ruania rhizosphaerae TaxID=1840413 RepID=UPI00135B68D3|nr:DUF4190 domain-containing protein [Ruania rhizosphaerae]
MSNPGDHPPAPGTPPQPEPWAAPSAWGAPTGQPPTPWQAPPGPDETTPAVPPLPAPPPHTPQPGPAGQSMYGSRPTSPQQDQGSYGQFTFPVMQRATLEPTAVASVATALLGPVAVFLGVLARTRIKRNRRRSMALAWTGIGLGSLFTIAWVLTTVVLAGNGTIDRLTESPQAGDVATARTVGASNVAVGNCIEFLPPGEQVGEVQLVPCAQSHIAQAISSHELTGDFPGADAVAEEALATCEAAVSALESDGVPESGLTAWYLAPTEEAWGQGTTAVLCLARGSTGPFDGDLLSG